MLTISNEKLTEILNDFNIHSEIVSISELQRSHYEENDPASKEVRLIVKVELENGNSVVVRFKNESDVTLEIVKAQSQFAKLLAEHRIETPALFSSNREYARIYAIGDYEVIVTVEAFVTGEIHMVTEEIAEKTGALLARTHNIAEAANFHVQNDILFDPLGPNDLFSFQNFQDKKEFMVSVDASLYKEIVEQYDRLLEKIRIFEKQPKYAVQGDISDCNLYQTPDGTVGIFDFNRCGDAVLYYDAVMQAVFEARLMDYPKEIDGRQESLILSAFLRGYHRERPFTDEQKDVFHCLYAVISAFWDSDIRYGSNSLWDAVEAQDEETVRQWMKKIHRRLNNFPDINY